MPRFAMKIEYDGEPFAGWQRQNDVPSVQAAIEQAIEKLEPGTQSIAAAGRTDAGVHAWGQVAHVDLARSWRPFELKNAINQHLKPAPVAVLALEEVSDDWHARFSAIERQYLFRVVARRAPLGLDRGRLWNVKNQLDVSAMQAGADYLIGHHDFTTFRSSICQAKSPEKTMDEVSIKSVDYPGGQEYQFFLRARSFLHNQVRSIVGSLVKVGSGSWEPADIRAALVAKDRSECGPVAPPHGLYLSRVRYSDEPFEG